MKKQLLSLGMMCSSFLVTSQTLISENFNALTVGNFANSTILNAQVTPAQGNWYVTSFMANPVHSSFQIANVASGDNRLNLSGSASSSGNNYVEKAIDFSSRTTGNNVAFAEFKFNTGAVSSSKNEFNFYLMSPDFSKTLVGLTYVSNTKVMKGVAFDSTDVLNNGDYIYNSLGLGNTEAVLENNKDYYCSLAYDFNTGTVTWLVSLWDSPYTVSINASDKLSLISKPSQLGFAVLKATAGASNTSSNTVGFDEIFVNARPCFDYSVKANASFSYTPGSHCLGTANLTPVLVATNSTGSFTSTSGLNLNATSGVINLGTGTLAGTYDVKFVTVDPYVSGSVAGACPDSATVSITILSCAGIEDVITNKFSVYPNPTNDIVTVSLSDLVISEGTIKLTSADGKLIEAREFNNSTVESFDVKSLKAGIYFFQIGNTTEKVVIK